METILFKDTATTVTYDNDCIIPTTDYGERVPVEVEIDTTDLSQVENCITIVIGDKRFLPSEVQHWWILIERARELAKTLK